MKNKKPLNHLTLVERQTIHTMKRSGFKDSEISKVLGRHRSTIGRELGRNKVPYTLKAGLSPLESSLLCHHKALRRRSDSKRGRRKSIKLANVRARIIELLETRKYSPESISDILVKEKIFLSGKTIRRWIKSDATLLKKNLPQRGKKRRSKLRPRRILKPKRSIHQRRKVVNNRKRVGDFEADAVVCSQSKVSIISVRERKTRKRWFKKVPNLKAQSVRQALIKVFREIPSELRKTCTYDNGTEFAEHLVLEKNFGLKSYFADPYCSWQKGAVEHQNMELRRYIPKGTNLELVTEEELSRYEQYLNEKPMDCLGKRSAEEVWQDSLSKLAA